MAEGQYTSTERVYVDRDGKRVDAKDPNRHTLLVAEGGSIPMEQARKAGLVGDSSTAEPSDSTDDSADAIDAAEESARIQGKTSAKKSAKKGK